MTPSPSPNPRSFPNRPRRGRRAVPTVAAVGAVALLLTACSGGEQDGDSSAAATGPITLTVATFNEFGYDTLFAEYTKLNPGVTVEHKKAATSDEARANFMTKLAAGSGLSDVEAIEVDWLPEAMEASDGLLDLTSDDVEGRWLDWKTEMAMTADGKLVGYGTDIGPEAICYRSDLFAKAGLPTDRAEVATAMGTTWQDYFDLGKKFVAASDGVAWFDSTNAIFQGQVNQLENAFSSSDTEETIIPLDQNAPIKKLYADLLTAGVTDKLSAGLDQWSPDWQNGFQQNAFATMLCPGWMLGVIEGNAKGVTGWDIANVFPGGGGNWGGSYLTVPASGPHPEEARKLAAWLTAPEQQITAFKAKGTFPSQVEALTSPELLAETKAFFNNAPTGQILADRAKAVTVIPYKGPSYFAVRQAITDAINRVDVTEQDTPDASWRKAVADVEALG